MSKWTDNIDRCINECKETAERYGVVMFKIEIGDETTYQSFKRKENWSQYKKRLRSVIPASEPRPTNDGGEK